MLFDILIYPIEAFLRFIFELLHGYSNDYIVTTILLSIMVNIILLPAYNLAERIQKKEAKLNERLKPIIDEFKRVYSGAQLHAVISRLYKINHYHPIYAMRSLSGLAIQLPFFIAAFHFLSNYEVVKGVETYLFNDLSKPDQWLSIGMYHINLMPFIMTVINISAVFIYTKNITNSMQKQTIFLAFVFLVLLYNSPAILLLYWTSNNLFSFIKYMITSTSSKINISYNFFHFTKSLLAKIYTLVEAYLSNNLIKKMIFVIVILSIFVGVNNRYNILTEQKDCILTTNNIEKENKWASVKFTDDALIIHAGSKKPTIANLKIKKDMILKTKFYITESLPGEIEFSVYKNDAIVDSFIVQGSDSHSLYIYLQKDDSLKIIADKHGVVSYDEGGITLKYRTVNELILLNILALILTVIIYVSMFKKISLLRIITNGKINNSTQLLNLIHTYLYKILFFFTVLLSLFYTNINSYKMIDSKMFILKAENLTNNSYASVRFDDNALIIHAGSSKPTIANLTIKEDILLKTKFYITESLPGEIEFSVYKNDIIFDKFIVQGSDTHSFYIYLQKNDILKIIADKHGAVSYDEGGIDLKYKTTNELVLSNIILLILSMFSYLLLFDKYKVLDHLSNSETNTLIKLLFLIPSLIAFIVPISSIISSSPNEFNEIWKLIGISIYASFGIYIFSILVYNILNNSFRNLMLFVYFFIASYFILNYYIFTGDYGIMDFFIFHHKNIFDGSLQAQLYDISVIIGLIFFLFFILKKIKYEYLKNILITVLFFLVSSVSVSLYKIVINYEDAKLDTANQNIDKKFIFSKDKKNVLVIFFDRFVGGFVPYILDDLPHLKHELSGFKWYPNMISFGKNTAVSMPSIYAGYKYTDVDAMLKEKIEWEDSTVSGTKKRFRESVGFLPTIFSNLGYSAFIADPYVDDKYMKTLSKDKYKYDYLVKNRKYINMFYSGSDSKSMKKFNSANFFYSYLLPFSIFKVISPTYREEIYNNGKWYSKSQHHWIERYKEELAYAKAWPYISDVSSSIGGSYNFVTSLLTHDVYAARDNGEFIGETPKKTLGSVSKKLMDSSTISKADIKRFKDGTTAVHYYGAKEALVRVNEWVKWLKKNNIYDNTKIIIISDHGFARAYDSMFAHQDSKDDVTYSSYHATLFVKDFNQTGLLEINNDFMTTADVPYLALKDIDNKLSSQLKFDKKDGFRVYINYKNKNLLVVKKNIFDERNWLYTSYKEKGE